MEKSSTPFTFNIAGRNRSIFNTPEMLIESIETPRDLSRAERAQILDDTWQAIQKPFEDKTPVPADKKAVLFSTHGAPGSGKTHDFHDFYKRTIQTADKNWVYIAYDEHGVIESLSGWQNEIAALEKNSSFEDRLRIRDRYRDASQVGRDLIFHRALTQHFNIMNDVTNSGPPALAVMKSAREHGFQNAIASYFAPYEISKERVINRTRPASLKEEIIGKRIGAFMTFEPIMNDLIKNNEDMICFYNPSNSSPRETVFNINDGQVYYANQAVMRKIEIGLISDVMPLYKDDASQIPAYMEAVRGKMRAFKTISREHIWAPGNDGPG